MKRLLLILVLLLSACTTPFQTTSPVPRNNPAPSPSKVIVGLDVLLDEQQDLISGKKIGLVTNHTGVDKNGTANYDRLLALNNIDLKVVFSPEHGLFGESAAGEKVNYNGQLKTLPKVVSLYGKNRKPTSEQISGLDVILYDIQDVGARFYTYISTMGMVMEAAAESGVKMIILDRPNPITGTNISGPILEMKHQSFVGYYPIPIRYGMTAGELARMIVEEKWIEYQPNLQVIKMKGWKRDFWYSETDLAWIKPSPNIPDLETAIIYPGMCLLEATNISEGRGTEKPFKRFGAPWINKKDLANELNNLNLPGVIFKPISFVPSPIKGMANNPKYNNQVCQGAEIVVTNREKYKSVMTGTKIINVIKEKYPEYFKLKNSGMNRLWGKSDHNFGNYTDPNTNSEFIETAKQYYLYK